MTKIVDQLISFITSPHHTRDDAKLESSVISWLRRKVKILKSMDVGNMLTVLKQCQHISMGKDEVIIKQGDVGDRMFILLRGSAMVYIDPNLTGEEDLVTFTTSTGSPVRELDDMEDEVDDKTTAEKHSFGKYIMKYTTGMSFGEAALIAEDKTRNATIVSETVCELLVINQTLFDQAFKENQEFEFAEICEFVEKHNFFSHMSPKFKRLLELSLRKETFMYESAIVRQGEPVKALYFILSGQATVTLEPQLYQKQYPSLWPFEAGLDLYAREFEWLRESRRAAILRKHKDPNVWETKTKQVVVKRTDGYAASEKRIKDKKILLCTVQSGETIGDTEAVQRLPTYMSTVICTCSTTVYVLHLKNLERIVGRKNQVTMSVMRDAVKEKLTVRAKSKSGQEIGFLGYLLQKIEEEILPAAKPLPAIKTSKELPPKEIQIQHLLERFKVGAAELVMPFVPGALIYREEIREKAKTRANVQRHRGIAINTMIREVKKKSRRRQPRSRREIILSLQEMMKSELLNNIDVSKSRKKKQTENTSKSLPGSRNADSTPKPIVEPYLGDEKETSCIKQVRFAENETFEERNFRDKQIDTAVSQIEKKELASTELIKYLDQAENLKDDQNENKNKSNSNLENSVKDNVDDIIPPHNGDTHEYIKRQVPATPEKTGTRFPPLVKTEIRKSGTSKADKINFNKSESLPKDKEQNKNSFGALDGELSVLEARISEFIQRSAFHTSSLPGNRNQNEGQALPKLKRFSLKLQTPFPKPGGKVLVRKKICRFANTDKKVTNHDHVRYHMVPKLPEIKSSENIFVSQKLQD